MMVFSFVRHDCIENFIVHGIRQDYASTAADNKALWAATILSGPALAAGNSLWGFVVKPTGRVVFGGIAAEGGMLAGTITGIWAWGLWGQTPNSERIGTDDAEHAPSIHH
jgi:hypothetical protein